MKYWQLYEELYINKALGLAYGKAILMVHLQNFDANNKYFILHYNYFAVSFGTLFHSTTQGSRSG